MSEVGYWILRCEHRLLTRVDLEVAGFFPYGPARDFGSPAGALLVGEWLGRPCYAAELDEFPVIASAEATPLRVVFEIGGAEAFALAGRAVQLLDWQKHHRFCGQCGTPTERLVGEHAMRCPNCGLQVYPRLSPAVMVLVRDGERLLLARSPRSSPACSVRWPGLSSRGKRWSSVRPARYGRRLGSKLPI